jgi:hypothetical protein
MAEDMGKHYRYSYKGIKLDPYRVCLLYNVGGGPREHILKKCLRGTTKGHTERQVIDEIQSCLDRWKEMVAEDELERISKQG